MKRLKLLVFIILIFALSACSKSKVENYETKNREVDSVFDKIEVPNKSKREKIIKKETESEKETEKESEIETKNDSTSETDIETKFDENVETKTTIRNVKLRAKPIRDAELITVIDEGEKVIILEEDVGFGWTKIEYEEFKGFVDGSLLE